MKWWIPIPHKIEFFHFGSVKPKLTPRGPTWNPCTVMRTVSPTLALLGVIKSFGPFGAAEERLKQKKKEKKKKKKRQRSSHCVWRIEAPALSQEEWDKCNFLSIKVTRQKATDLAGLFIRTMLLDLFALREKKRTQLGGYSLLEENGSAAGGVWRRQDKGHSES